MNNLDLDKLCEECGELVQAAAKLKLFYSTPDQSWEKTEAELVQALRDEVADATAAISMVIGKRQLDEAAIMKRATVKTERFLGWGFYD